MVKRTAEKLICAFLHHYPFYRGYTKIQHARLTRLLFEPQERLWKATLRNGIKLSVELSDDNGRGIALFGLQEPAVVAVCQALLRPGDCFLDIGANYGTVGFFCAEAVGSEGRVHLVEPQTKLSRAALDASCQSKWSSVIVCHQLALADRDGALTLHLIKGHSGGASLFGGGDPLIVEARSTERFVQEQAGDRPVGAKVDVEGAEHLILPALLRSPKVKFLVFETGGETEQLIELVRSHGFAIYGLETHAFSVGLRPRDERHSKDVVAIRGAFAPAEQEYLRLDALRKISF